RLTDSLKPIWEKLETKITQNEIMQVDILSLGDIIKKYDIEKDWDNNGKNYNKYKQTFAMIEKEYANNELEKNEFDTTIQEVFEKRKFVEAGERLKYILRNNSAFSTHFENKALIRFIDAILNYLDFEKIGKKEIRMYLFTELAQMRCEPQNTYILYPHKPHKRLQKYYERHKIPLVLTNMYPVQLKEKVKQIEVPLNEQKHFSQVKSSEVAPNQLSEVSPVILFSKKSEQLKLSESKYSPVNNKQNDFIDHEDFKLESLEEKRQEPKIFSSLPLRQPRHNLSSLQIHSAFFSPVITPGTATKVGSVILDLSMVITILAQIQCGGAPQSLIFAEDKVEKALNQLKFLNAARSDSSQQDNVTYSPRTVVI
ncbi:MAG: hypothetical protein JO131_08375, partial [Gammaproteobacteria bacterium]|nr:hypothetical protein [Gammaproteobacteria bacterium]